MTEASPPLTIVNLLSRARERLDQAVAFGRAAEACAQTTALPEALSILLEIEPLLYQVNTFVNAGSLLNREKG